MKGSPEVIVMLNNKISEKYRSVIRLTAHAAMCTSWGYEKLSSTFEEKAKFELVSIKEITQRLLYLGGSPTFREEEFELSSDVLGIFPVEQKLELNSIASTVEGIEICSEQKDFGSENMLRSILVKEERQLELTETRMSQIAQMGIENYLRMQLG